MIYTVYRDGAPPIRFDGELHAEVSSRRAVNNGGRWTRLRLYLTRAGRYIASECGVTCWEGERNRNAAWLCDSEVDVIKALGHGSLAHELYDEACIDYAEEVE